MRQINAFPFGVKRSYINLPNHGVATLHRPTGGKRSRCIGTFTPAPSITQKQLNLVPFRTDPYTVYKLDAEEELNEGS